MINNNLFEPYQGFIRGNMFKNIFDQYGKIYDVKPLNEQAELLTYIDVYTFACLDLKLYLDIYNNDKEILNMYNLYLNELKKYMMEYETKFISLSETNNSLEGSWNWLSLFPKEV